MSSGSSGSASSGQQWFQGVGRRIDGKDPYSVVSSAAEETQQQEQQQQKEAQDFSDVEVMHDSSDVVLPALPSSVIKKTVSDMENMQCCASAWLLDPTIVLDTVTLEMIEKLMMDTSLALSDEERLLGQYAACISLQWHRCKTAIMQIRQCNLDKLEDKAEETTETLKEEKEAEDAMMAIEDAKEGGSSSAKKRKKMKEGSEGEGGGEGRAHNKKKDKNDKIGKHVKEEKKDDRVEHPAVGPARGIS